MMAGSSNGQECALRATLKEQAVPYASPAGVPADVPAEYNALQRIGLASFGEGKFLHIQGG